MNAPSTAWAITDGAAGNENQALALAQALGCSAEPLRLATHAPWRWFAPRLVPADAAAFGASAAARLHLPPPPIAIGCGRQAALALRWLKCHHGAAIRCVQILDPRIDPHVFDAVVVPEHDVLRGPNVLTTHGALNAVDDAWLAAARDAWQTLHALPAPRTAALLGGPTTALRLDAGYWRSFATQLRALHARDGGSVLVTSSRRTPAWLRDAARTDLADIPGMQWHGPEDGPNPYAGFLALADRIVVTPDSVNLLSEACATPVPVFFHAPQPVAGKIGRFVASLERSGRLQRLGSTANAQSRATTIEPLRETARIADALRHRFGLG